MTLTQTTTHIEGARSNFIDAFKGKPNIQALLDAYIQQVQEIENALFQLLENRTLETAVGVQLDNLGRLIGQARGELSDADYRILLRARILANKSNGTIDDIVEMLQIATSGSSVGLQEFEPAAMIITLTSFGSSNAVLLANLIADARPAGVGTDFVYPPSGAAFQYDTVGAGFDLGEYSGVTEA